MTRPARKPTKRGNGEGSTRLLPSGNWRWEVMVEGQRHGGTAPSKTLARQAAARLIADATRGGVVDPSTETLGEYLTRWLEARRASRAVRTHEIQADHLERHILPVIGKERLQKLSPAHLRRLFDSLNRAGLGASSQRQVHQFLISALGDALRLELVIRNVAETVKPSPVRGKERGELQSFTAQEAAQFAQAAAADRWGAPFLFALSTGMRRGEVVGLRWQDVELDAAQAHVREIVAEGLTGTIVTTPKTGNSRRTVYLSPDVVTLLRGLLAAQEGQRAALNSTVRGHGQGYARKRPWADSGRVFVNSYGGTLAPGNLKRDMARICAAAGVRELPIHGLRHTYASLALRGGVPVEVVSKQLGHASPAFTLTQYRTVFTSEREKWALNLSELVGQ